MPKVKHKKRIIKAARKKQLVTYRGILIRLSTNYQKKLCRLEGIGKKYAKSWKAGTYSQDCSTQRSYDLESKGDNELPRQEKTKWVHHYQTIIIWNVKGTYLKRRSKLWTVKWQKIQIYQQLNLKNKLSKQEEQRQNHGYREWFDGCQWEGGVGKWVKRWGD